MKVHFQCKGSVEKRKNTDSHCILIKYTGRFAGKQIIKFLIVIFVRKDI